MRRTAKALVVGATAVAALGASACEPMSLGLTLDRKVILDENPPRVGFETSIRLTGTISCTHGSGNPEPVDLFLRVSQGGREESAWSEPNIPCVGSEPQRWEEWFDFTTAGFPTTGQATATLTASTNPSLEIDEDWVRSERLIDIVNS